jgi:hypothetical protein
MKTLKQFCITTVLTLALSSTALAGIIDTPGVTAPPPPSDPAVTGEMSTPGIVATDTSGGETGIDSVAALAEYLFSSMMSSVF